jgi:hypothetical protein
MGKQTAALTKRVDSKILLIRGLRVILDVDLEELYGVEVRSLNQQVKRNGRRFPDDFLLQLTGRRSRKLEITKCDFKFRSWRAASPAKRIH